MTMGRTTSCSIPAPSLLPDGRRLFQPPSPLPIDFLSRPFSRREGRGGPSPPPAEEDQHHDPHNMGRAELTTHTRSEATWAWLRKQQKTGAAPASGGKAEPVLWMQLHAQKAAEKRLREELSEKSSGAFTAAAAPAGAAAARELTAEDVMLVLGQAAHHKLDREKDLLELAPHTGKHFGSISADSTSTRTTHGFGGFGNKPQAAGSRWAKAASSVARVAPGVARDGGRPQNLAEERMTDFQLRHEARLKRIVKTSSNLSSWRNTHDVGNSDLEETARLLGLRAVRIAGRNLFPVNSVMTAPPRGSEAEEHLKTKLWNLIKSHFVEGEKFNRGVLLFHMNGLSTGHYALVCGVREVLVRVEEGEDGEELGGIKVVDEEEECSCPVGVGGLEESSLPNAKDVMSFSCVDLKRAARRCEQEMMCSAGGDVDRSGGAVGKTKRGGLETGGVGLSEHVGTSASGRAGGMTTPAQRATRASFVPKAKARGLARSQTFPAQKNRESGEQQVPVRKIAIPAPDFLGPTDVVLSAPPQGPTTAPSAWRTSASAAGPPAKFQPEKHSSRSTSTPPSEDASSSSATPTKNEWSSPATSTTTKTLTLPTSFDVFSPTPTRAPRPCLAPPKTQQPPLDSKCSREHSNSDGDQAKSSSPNARTATKITVPIPAPVLPPLPSLEELRLRKEKELQQRLVAVEIKRERNLPFGDPSFSPDTCSEDEVVSVKSACSGRALLPHERGTTLFGDAKRWTATSTFEKQLSPRAQYLLDKALSIANEEPVQVGLSYRAEGWSWWCSWWWKIIISLCSGGGQFVGREVWTRHLCARDR